MSETLASRGAWAHDMRLEFDRSFHEPAAKRLESPEIMLAVRIGDQPHALRIRQISGLFTDCVLTEVPTSVASLLGVTALRGAIVPVFSLSVLLGYPASRRPRWMALIGTNEAIGLAFDQLEGHIQHGVEDIVRPNETDLSGDFGCNVVRCGPTIRPVVDLESLLLRIPRRLPESGSSRI